MNQDFKVVSIFLASSIVDFKHDRDSLAHFFLGLNNVSVFNGVYFKLVLCEDLDSSVARKRKQAEYNKIIEESDFCIVLADKKVGKYTWEEFQTAYSKFCEDGTKPKIYVYVKENETVEDSLTQFLKYLADDIQHYYDYFSSIDSLKLKILLQINLSRGGFVIACSPDYIMLNNERLLAMEEVSFFSSNSKIKALVNENNGYEQEYRELSEKDNKTKEEQARFYELTGKIARNRTAIYKIQKEIFDATHLLYGKEITSFDVYKRRNINRLLEEGDYEGVKKLINDEELEERIQTLSAQKRALLRQLEELNEAFSLSIDDFLLKAYVCKQLSEVENWELYLKKAYDVAIAEELRPDVLYTYAECLWQRRDLNGSFKVFEEYLRAEKADNLVGRANALRYMGVTKYDLLDFDASRRCFMQSQALYEEYLAAGEQDDETKLRYSSMIRDLGMLQYFNAEYGSAYELQSRAEKMQEEFVEGERSILFYSEDGKKNIFETDNALWYGFFDYFHALGHTYSALGDVCLMQDRKAECAEKYEKGLKIRLKLYEYNAKDYTIDLAWSYYDMANYAFINRDFARSESYFKEAVALMRALCEQDKKRYNTYLRRCLQGLADAQEGMGVTDHEVLQEIADLKAYDGQKAPWENLIPQKRREILQ